MHADASAGTSTPRLAAGHGFVRFTIPYTADHLREHAAHDALESLGDDEG